MKGSFSRDRLLLEKKVLREALSLIQDNSRWCKNAPARDQHGNSVDCRSYEAIQWCAIGAITKVSPDQETANFLTLKYRHLTKVNDEKGHSQVKKELLKLAKLA